MLENLLQLEQHRRNALWQDHLLELVPVVDPNALADISLHCRRVHFLYHPPQSNVRRFQGENALHCQGIYPPYFIGEISSIEIMHIGQDAFGHFPKGAAPGAVALLIMNTGKQYRIDFEPRLRWFPKASEVYADGQSSIKGLIYDNICWISSMHGRLISGWKEFEPPDTPDTIRRLVGTLA